MMSKYMVFDQLPIYKNFGLSDKSIHGFIKVRTVRRRAPEKKSFRSYVVYIKFGVSVKVLET